MHSLVSVDIKETVSFHVLGNYVFCVRYTQVYDSTYCDVYAATSEPFEVDGKVEERYNLVDMDGTVVEDFPDACLILSVADVHVYEGELFFGLHFNADYFMNYSEFEAVHELLEESVKPGLKSFMGNEEVENSIELLNGKV